MIGRFGGARLSEFLQDDGRGSDRPLCYVECADDYYESLDMATAMHPQTLLCYEMYDQPLTREHGAPLRLSVPTKIGYKQAKYLTGPESQPRSGEGRLLGRSGILVILWAVSSTDELREEGTACEAVIEIESAKTGESVPAVYEHPWVVRFCHWLNAVSLFVMVGSGLQIFRAFPSFGAKIPQKDLLNWPKAFALGGWLGGALQWHLTFMWIYIATGMLYLGYQMFSGNYRQVLFTPRDIPRRMADGAPLFFLRPQAGDQAKPTTRCRNTRTPPPLVWECCRC